MILDVLEFSPFKICWWHYFVSHWYLFTAYFYFMLEITNLHLTIKKSFSMILITNCCLTNLDYKKILLNDLDYQLLFWEIGQRSIPGEEVMWPDPREEWKLSIHTLLMIHLYVVALLLCYHACYYKIFWPCQQCVYVLLVLGNCTCIA